MAYSVCCMCRGVCCTYYVVCVIGGRPFLKTLPLSQCLRVHSSGTAASRYLGEVQLVEVAEAVTKINWSGRCSEEKTPELWPEGGLKAVPRSEEDPRGEGMSTRPVSMEHCQCWGRWPESAGSSMATSGNKKKYYEIFAEEAIDMAWVLLWQETASLWRSDQTRYGGRWPEAWSIWGYVLVTIIIIYEIDCDTMENNALKSPDGDRRQGGKLLEESA